MKMLTFVKNRDAFGHEVKLTLKDCSGREQTSVCGGIFTLLIYGFISAYFIIKSIKMMGSNLDNIASNEEIVNFNELGNVNLTGMTPIITFVTLDPSLVDYIDFIAK